MSKESMSQVFILSISYGILNLLSGYKNSDYIMSVEIYTDGACKGNPGPGGWGVLLRYNGIEKTMHGGEPHTTNNRMELMAAIKGLESLKRPCEVDL
jgi:hypothetical protein